MHHAPSHIQNAACTVVYHTYGIQMQSSNIQGHQSERNDLEVAMAHNWVIGASDLGQAIGARLCGSLVELQEATATMHAFGSHIHFKRNSSWLPPPLQKDIFTPTDTYTHRKRERERELWPSHVCFLGQSIYVMMSNTDLTWRGLVLVDGWSSDVCLFSQSMLWCMSNTTLKRIFNLMAYLMLIYLFNLT